MNDFNRGNRSGGNRNFGKPRFNNDRPEMHQATCATCGKSCEVPFRPTGSKPIYCSDCFRKNAGEERFQNRGSDRSQSIDRQMYDAVCSKCGDNCKIPFRPTQGRDIFCSRCFDMQGGSEGGRPERKTFDRSNTNEAPNYKAQFEALNAKLDKILALLQPTSVAVQPLESVINEEAIDEIVEEVQEEKKELTVKKPRKAKTATKAKKKASPKKK